MIEVKLTFRETKEGLIGMMVEAIQNDPTMKEKIVASQVEEYLMESKIPSKIVASGRGATIEEAKENASLERDIYLAGQGGKIDD